MTEPRPEPSSGLPPRRPLPPPSRPGSTTGTSFPPDPVDLVLGLRPENPAPAPQWTFGPDEVPDPARTDPAQDRGTGLENRHHPSRGLRLAPRVGMVVIVAALITGALAVTHIGPFHSSARAATPPSPPAGASTDVRGVWNVLDTYAGAFAPATMHIATENLSTGTFSGTITSPVGIETITGRVSGAAVSFTISLGTGTEQGSAFVSRSGSKVRIQGTFANPTGGHGTIIATRTSS